jgi:hypothetical protein
MIVARYQPRQPLIVVRGRVWGRRGGRSDLRLALDTAATITTIEPHVLDVLGYSAREGEGRSIIRSAVAEEPGYLIRVERLRALGHESSDLLVHAHDLPEGYGIDGLIGLNFLDQFVYEIRPHEGRILVERIGAA